MMIDHGFCVEPSMLRASMAARGLYATIAAFLGLSRLPSVAVEALPFAVSEEVTTALDELAAAGMLLVLDDETVTLAPLANAFARASMSPSEPSPPRDTEESEADRKRRIARDKKRDQRAKTKGHDGDSVPGTDGDNGGDMSRGQAGTQRREEEKREEEQENTPGTARATGGGQVGDTTGTATQGQMGDSLQGTTGAAPLALSPPPAKRQRAPRATDVATLPVGWEPGAELRSYATERGIDAERLLEDFRDYWTAGGGSRERRTVSGWEQTWRGRVRDAVDRRRFLAGASKGPTRSYGATRAAPRQGDLDANGNGPNWDDIWELQERDDAAAAAKAAGKVA